MSKQPNRRQVNIVVRTEIPGPESQKWIEREKLAESGGNAYPNFFGTGRHAPVFQEVDGVCLVDVDGNHILDTSGCYSCGTLGYLPSELVEVATEQMRKMVHLPDAPNVPRIELAEEIKRISPGELAKGRVQYELGGGGAMDLAIKVAYYYARMTQTPVRPRVMSFWGNYHGRTVATLSITGSAHAQVGMPQWGDVAFMPYPYCYRCPFGREYPACDLACLTFVENAFKWEMATLNNPATHVPQVSIVFFEPIQAHLGMIVPPLEFFPGIRRLCDEYGMVLVDDEVAMGFGHTGHWFACEHYGVVPDVLGMAKALTGGVWPLGAVIAKKEIMDVWGAECDKHMGSYHGNPVGCAVALQNIRLIKERGLLENANDQGRYMLEGMKDMMSRHRMLGEVVGVGLVLGAEIVRDKKTKEPASEETRQLVLECLRHGVLILRLGPFGNRLNMMPSLDTTREEADIILRALDESLAAVERGTA
jgi:4-aminobutyrate aminotransferase-like enzyme